MQLTISRSDRMCHGPILDACCTDASLSLVSAASVYAPSLPVSDLWKPALFPSISQWEFQDLKMEVPTIYKAYIRPM